MNSVKKTLNINTPLKFRKQDKIPITTYRKEKSI